MKYDIAIIGGGPAGYNAAEKAAINGMKVVLFEKNKLGGVCLNEGCIPTKTFLYSVKLLDNLINAGKYGLQAKDIAANHAKILHRKNKIVRKLTTGVQYKLTAIGVDIVNQQATIQGEADGYIRINAGNSTYEARYLLLCTGSETIIPPINGLKEGTYWTSKEALNATELPRSITIIGGGVIGIELAAYFNTMGVEVTIIEMTSKILGNMDGEISRLLQDELRKKGIHFYLNAAVQEITTNNPVIETKGMQEKISFETLLISTGRRPNASELGLENLQIETEKNAVKVNKHMQTNHPRVYAAGDITGFSLLAHTAIREGEVAINHILGQSDEMSYRAIPTVVYTNPELAGVGKTEEELIAENIYHRVIKLPMTYSGRFVVENEGVNGLCKLIVDANDHIIGCHMLGNMASELITIAAIAVEEGYTVGKFRRFVFPHPTTGEIIREVLFE